MNNNQEDQESVVFGHNYYCQTMNAKWLGLENVYEKFLRPNVYDIGGTYIEQVQDHWFTCMTKEVGDIFLLELFINCCREEPFNIALGDTNELRTDKKTNIAYLDSTLKHYNISDTRDSPNIHLTTYYFTKSDINIFKTMKLYIRFSVYYTSNAVHRDALNYVKANHNFGELLNDPYGSDFTIVSSEGEKFEVHRVLLSAHSEVFKAMLKEETAECQNGYVKLVDVCKADLKCILEFIYTGTVKELENNNCINLLMLADRYNLNGLKYLAQHALLYKIDIENALEILVLADMYNAELLKSTALKFIKKFSSTLNSNEFNEINNAELVRELCKYISS